MIELQTIYEARKHMEAKILSALRDFQSITGLTPGDIRVHKIDITDQSSQLHGELISDVEVTVTLPPSRRVR